MAIENLESNGPDYANEIVQKKIFLRKDSTDEQGEEKPLTFIEMDNNLELIRAKINEIIAELNS